jgi:hypothetical protein
MNRCIHADEASAGEMLFAHQVRGISAESLLNSSGVPPAAARVRMSNVKVMGHGLFSRCLGLVEKSNSTFAVDKATQEEMPHLGWFLGSASTVTRKEDTVARMFGAKDGISAAATQQFLKEIHEENVAGGVASNIVQGLSVLARCITRLVGGSFGNRRRTPATEHIQRSTTKYEEEELPQLLVEHGLTESSDEEVADALAAAWRAAREGHVDATNPLFAAAQRCAASERGQQGYTAAVDKAGGRRAFALQGYNGVGGLRSRTTEERSADGQRGYAAAAAKVGGPSAFGRQGYGADGGLASRSTAKHSADSQRGYNGDGGLGGRTTEEHSADSKLGGRAAAANYRAQEGTVTRTYQHKKCRLTTDTAAEPNPSGVSANGRGGFQGKKQQLRCKHCETRPAIGGGQWQLLGKQRSDRALCGCPKKCGMFQRADV